MTVLTSIASFLAAIMLLVFIHEYGHFKVARLCGVKVKRFSIGFGSPFWSRTDRHGTEWALAPFPLGGYVQMADSRVAPLHPDEQGRGFDSQPILARAAILAAGPLANLLFAWAAWAFMLTGSVQDLAPALGSAVAGSLADKAGFHPSDVARAVDGSPVRSLQEVQMALIADAVAGRDAKLSVERGGSVVELVLPASPGGADLLASEGLAAFGFANAGGARLPAAIRGVAPGSPADRGGLRSGDLVLSIDGTPVDSWSAMAAAVNGSAGRALALRVSNEGHERTVSVTPEVPAGSHLPYAKIGAMLDESSLTPAQKSRAYVQVDRGALGAMRESASRCWQVTSITAKALASMATGASGSSGVSGPVGIAKQAGDAASDGASSFLNFLAFLSLSLFFMNLLPLPVLDGGHLALLALEAAMGRPLSERSMARIGQIGVSFLFCLMALALFNDIAKLLR